MKYFVIASTFANGCSLRNEAKDGLKSEKFFQDSFRRHKKCRDTEARNSNFDRSQIVSSRTKDSGESSIDAPAFEAFHPEQLDKDPLLRFRYSLILTYEEIEL
jgi:hypothetical protein